MEKIRLITEKKDVQDRAIDYLQTIGWEYIPPADLQEKRGYDIKEPFILEILEKKLKELYLFTFFRMILRR